jgi:hypothetical protein
METTLVETDTFADTQFYFDRERYRTQRTTNSSAGTIYIHLQDSTITIMTLTMRSQAPYL